MSFANRALIASIAFVAVGVPSFAVTNDWVVDNEHPFAPASCWK